MSGELRFATALDQLRNAVVLTYDPATETCHANWRAQPQHVAAIRQAEPDERPVGLAPEGVWDADLG